MEEIFNQTISKAEFLNAAASLGYICQNNGEHCTDGSVECEDSWYRNIGQAFCKLIQDEDFARLMVDNLREFIYATDSKKIGEIECERIRN